MTEFKSTRGGAELLSGSRAIIKGIADNKGLYVPNRIPKLKKELWEMRGMSYQDIAKEVIGSFFDDFTEEEISACVEGAYDSKFEAEEVAPLRSVGEVSFLELYHGKTAAFKDIALSILPYLMTTALKKEKEDNKICILAATSGDTGKAALEGFADVGGTEIVVFYPHNGVSQIQERQMVTQEGINTHVFAINGNFDDAQTGVKKIFNDDVFSEELLKKGIKLSSANSINIGRLVPQVAYYVYTYIKLLENGTLSQGEEFNVSVPTGNFGNILAAYYSKKMGVPIHKLICASNKNMVLTDFISSGEYNIEREFYLTNSPSMDILISSNLERLLYHLSGENGDEISSLMASLEKDRGYKASEEIKRGLSDFYGGFATPEETLKAIGEIYDKYNYLMDTHTAVAYKVYEDYKKESGDERKTVIVSTASAYKFADSVIEALGIEKAEDGFAAVERLNAETGIKIPKGLSNLRDKEVIHKGLIDVEDMKKAVLDSLTK